MTPDQKRVLLVDDDASVVSLLETELVMEGYGVVTVSDGTSAIEAVRAEELDCVLLDAVVYNIDFFIRNAVFGMDDRFG